MGLFSLVQRSYSVFIVFSLVFLISGCSSSTTSVSSTKKDVTTPAQQIIILGDEFGYGVDVLTTHTYAGYLKEILQKSDYNDVIVTSYARPGETMIGLQGSIASFSKDLNSGDIVIMTVGNNDLKQSMTQNMIQLSLEDILKSLRDQGIKVIVGVAPFDDSLDTTVTDNYVSMLQRVVPAHGGLVHTTMFANVIGIDTYLKANTVFPNEQGNEVVAKDVYTFLLSNGLLR